MIRSQYHFRTSSQGLLAWDVRRLVALTHKLPVFRVPVSRIAEIDENHWYSHSESVPTCRSMLGHYQLIREADTSFPIILDASGRVMDGMHRVCKVLLDGRSEIKAVQFEEDPEPDHVGKEPGSLEYDT